MNNNMQSYIGKLDDAVINVDLIKIGQIYGQINTDEISKTNKKENGKLKIAIDMEHCLDRFYGGYFSDWACGGQWNRALQFVQLLSNAFNLSNIEVIVFFDGTFKGNKILREEQSEVRHKIIAVLKHIRVIGTPPPKIWWLPPSGTKTFLRNALRNINIQVMQTVHDHSGEIIDYFHENKLHGIMGLNSNYIYANISHYYSSHELRLFYKGSLETKEFVVSKFLEASNLEADNLPLLAVFLNSNSRINQHNESTIKSVYEKLKIDSSDDFEKKLSKMLVILKKSPFSDIDEFIKIHDLCDNSKVLKETFNYYQNKFKGKKGVLHAIKNQKIENKKSNAPSSNGVASTSSSKLGGSDKTGTSKDKEHNDKKNNKIIGHDEKKEPANVAVVTAVIETVAEAAGVNDVKAKATAVLNGSIENADNKKKSGSTEKTKANKKDLEISFVYTLPAEVIKTALSRHQRGIMDSRIYHLLTKKEIILSQVLEDEQYREIPSINQFYRPARQMIYATLFNLYHQKYLCSKNNVSASTANEKKGNRQAGNKNKNFIPEVKIQEWIWRPQNEYRVPECVNAAILPWAVPTVQRLWFGTGAEDKQRRMKAFLTILRSDSPLMLNRGYVPQHMLVMACVLRYIITAPERTILSRPELDAFLATAFSLQLNNVEYTQDLTLPGVNVRGVFLASLFTQGVETASLANDACGVPLPWIMTNPWLFFDGKLFHLKLKMSTYVQNLRELCDDQIEVVMKIERFRKAILEGLEHNLISNQDILYRQQFVHPHLPQFSKQYTALSNIPSGNFFSNTTQANYFAQHNNLQITPRNSYLNRMTTKLLNHYRSGLGRVSNNDISLHQRGYQLKVGGIVVGSWADGVTNNSLNNQKKMINLSRTGRFSVQRGRTGANSRSNANSGFQSNVTRTIGRHGLARQNRNRKNKKKTNVKKTSKSTATTKQIAPNESSSDCSEDNNAGNKQTLKQKSKQESSVELSNGTIVVASDLSNSIEPLLKEESIVNDTKVDKSDNEKLSENTENESSSSSSTTDSLTKSKTITWQQPVAAETAPQETENTAVVESE